MRSVKTANDEEVKQMPTWNEAPASIKKSAPRHESDPTRQSSRTEVNQMPTWNEGPRPKQQ